MEHTGFGVIGVGTWGELHAHVYSDVPGGRLIAICDANLERAQQIADANSQAGETPTVYTDYHELLGHPRVQAVSIVLPDFLHRDAVIAAARAGKHILVEKPLATAEADALAMIGAARDAGVTLFVDFHNRWNPLFNHLKQSLDAGELGEPQLITYRLSDTLFVPTQMLKWAAQSSVAWFLASHCLDTLLWLMNSRGGGDAVESLSCLTSSRVLEREYGIDTPDFYLTTLRWKSGLITTIENSWILPEGGPSLVDIRCEVTGTKGAMVINAARSGSVQKHTDRVYYPDAFVAPAVHGRPTGFGAESIRHFATSVAQGVRPMVDGIDGLAVTRLILAMEESARLKETFEITDVFRV